MLHSSTLIEKSKNTTSEESTNDYRTCNKPETAAENEEQND
jgi:hypothetical protein